MIKVLLLFGLLSASAVTASAQQSNGTGRPKIDWEKFQSDMAASVRGCLLRFAKDAGKTALERSGLRSHVYRLTVRPSFLRPTFFQWTIRADGTSELLMRNFHRAPPMRKFHVAPGDGCSPGALRREQTKQIDQPTTAALLAEVDRIGFWNRAISGGWGTDGTSWLLQGRRHGRYHDLVAGNPSGELYAFGRKLGAIGGEMP